MAMHKRKNSWERKVRGKTIELAKVGEKSTNIPEYSSPLDGTEEEIEACKARVAEGARCWCAEKCNCRKCADTSECTLEAHEVNGGCWGCHKCSKCERCF